MLKKNQLLFSGLLLVASIGLLYSNQQVHFKPRKTTYEYQNKSSTYHFQTLAEDTNNIVLPAAGSWRDDFPESVNTVLGLAGHFNIFSKTMDLDDRPIEGNFATQELIRKGGNSTGHTGISYLQKSIQSNNEQAAFNNDSLILGSSFKFLPPTQTDGRATINGLKLNQTPKILKQDRDNLEYLNVDTELNRLSVVSTKLADHSKENMAVVENKWGGTITVDASHIPSEDNVKYLTIKARDFPGYSLSIMGISDVQKVIITVDTSGVNNFSTGGITLDSVSNSKNIMFNFYNMDSKTNYTGNIDWQSSNQATSNAILAPEATFTLASNGTFNGNIIARKYVGNNAFQTSTKFPDLPLPNETKPAESPELLSVPDVAFGTHSLNNQSTLIGQWRGSFQVRGIRNKELKVNVTLARQLTSNAVVASGVRWQLIRGNYVSGELTTSSQDFTDGSATISYWPEESNSISDLVSEWRNNKQNKHYDFYDMQISNLDTVTESGDYNATLEWTLVDSP